MPLMHFEVSIGCTAIVPIRAFNKRVYVVGVGGVGSWVVESLARSGISEIRLADLDDIA